MHNLKEIFEKAIQINGSQQELARKIGVSQFTISRWLKGEGVNSKYIQALSDATKNEITVEELIKALDHRKQRR